MRRAFKRDGWTWVCLNFPFFREKKPEKLDTRVNLPLWIEGRFNDFARWYFDRQKI